MDRSMCIRMVQTAPLALFTIGISILGITQEWEDSCETFIRPIGHAGVLFAFIGSAVYGSRLGMTVAFNMSLLLASMNEHTIVTNTLYIASIYMLQMCYCSENILILLSLSFLPIPTTLGIVDLFAHCGHVTLLASTSAVRTSTSFLLASALTVAFGLMRSTQKELSLISAMSASATFLHSYLTTTRCTHSEPWKPQRLWNCKYGHISTAFVILYAFSLFYAQMRKCEEDMLLHALHVGGIVSVVLYIYPQAANGASRVLKAIIIAAALLDSLFTGVKLTFVDDGVLWIRMISAVGMMIGIFLTSEIQTGSIQELPTSVDIEDTRNQCDGLKVIRMLGAPFYIICSFAVYSQEADIFVSFSRVVHICFILGGLSMEAIIHEDRLTSDIVRILLVCEFAAECATFSNGSVHETLNLSRIVILWMCVPFRTRSQKGVLSFDVGK